MNERKKDHVLRQHFPALTWQAVRVDGEQARSLEERGERLLTRRAAWAAVRRLNRERAA